MRKKEDNEGKKIIIGLAFLLMAIALYLLNEDKSKNQKSQIDIRSPKVQGLVNRHMQETGRKLTLDEGKGLIEKNKSLRDFQKSHPQRPYKVEPNKLEIAEYQERHNFNENIGRGLKKNSLPADPHQLIQTDLFYDEVDQAQSEEYKKEYTRQFIENAKKDGWEIKVDANYKVISVRPLGRKPSFYLIDGAGRGGR